MFLPNNLTQGVPLPPIPCGVRLGDHRDRGVAPHHLARERLELVGHETVDPTFLVLDDPAHDGHGGVFVDHQNFGHLNRRGLEAGVVLKRSVQIDAQGVGAVTDEAVDHDVSTGVEGESIVPLSVCYRSSRGPFQPDVRGHQWFSGRMIAHRTGKRAGLRLDEL